MNYNRLAEFTEELAYALFDIEDEEQYNKLVDIVQELEEKIVKEFDDANWPVDTDGIPCKLDDVVYLDGEKFLVVAISHKNKVNIREFAHKNSGCGAFWVKADNVTHKAPEPPDTQEKIYEDMVDLSVKYAKMQLHDAYCIEVEINKLLKRQIELDKKKFCGE